MVTMGKYARGEREKYHKAAAQLWGKTRRYPRRLSPQAERVFADGIGDKVLA
jgi:hypothetical protein